MYRDLYSESLTSLKHLKKITMNKEFALCHPHIIDKLYSLTSIEVINGTLDDIVVSYDFHLKMKSIHIRMNTVKWTEEDIKKHGRKQLVIEERNHYPFVHSERYEESVIWKNSLQTNQFNQWYNLTSLSLDTTITEIPNCCFFRCYSLKEISLPSTVTSIGVFAFKHCYSLSSITLPQSVRIIHEGAFSGCHFLTSITITNPSIDIKFDAFGNCPSLKDIFINNHRMTEYPFPVTYSQLKQLELLDISCSHCHLTSSDIHSFGTEIISHSSVKELSSNCFKKNESIIELTIPSTTTSLGQFCFAECRNLTKIVLPSTITTLPHCCFDHCQQLQHVIFTDRSFADVHCDSHAFNDCPLLSFEH